MKNSLRNFSLATICLSATFSLKAALPPLYESLSEYKSLLNNQELAKKLGSAEGIQDIKRTEKGFIITGNKYSLNVDLVYDPQDHPGPAKFHFVFHNLEPIKQEKSH